MQAPPLEPRRQAHSGSKCHPGVPALHKHVLSRHALLCQAGRQDGHMLASSAQLSTHLLLQAKPSSDSALPRSSARSPGTGAGVDPPYHHKAYYNTQAQGFLFKT